MPLANSALYEPYKAYPCFWLRLFHWFCYHGAAERSQTQIERTGKDLPATNLTIVYQKIRRFLHAIRFCHGAGEHREVIEQIGHQSASRTMSLANVALQIERVICREVASKGQRKEQGEEAIKELEKVAEDNLKISISLYRQGGIGEAGGDIQFPMHPPVSRLPIALQELEIAEPDAGRSSQ